MPTPNPDKRSHTETSSDAAQAGKSANRTAWVLRISMAFAGTSTRQTPAISARSSSSAQTPSHVSCSRRRPRQKLPDRAGSFPHRDCGARRRSPFLLPASTKSRARSPTPSATFKCRLRKRADAPESNPTLKSSSASLAAWASTSARWFRSARSGTTGDLGQSLGAQAGEADRHAVGLKPTSSSPGCSPFDPLAALNEVERLVPGSTLSNTYFNE